MCADTLWSQGCGDGRLMGSPCLQSNNHNRLCRSRTVHCRGTDCGISKTPLGGDHHQESSVTLSVTANAWSKNHAHASDCFSRGWFALGACVMLFIGRGSMSSCQYSRHPACMYARSCSTHMIWPGTPLVQNVDQARALQWHRWRFHPQCTILHVQEVMQAEQQAELSASC